jgi:hypothetical protein
MRTLCDYLLKVTLLFFIFARFVSGPAPETRDVSAGPVQEPSSESQI